MLCRRLRLRFTDNLPSYPVSGFGALAGQQRVIHHKGDGATAFQVRNESPWSFALIIRIPHLLLSLLYAAEFQRSRRRRRPLAFQIRKSLISPPYQQSQPDDENRIGEARPVSGAWLQLRSLNHIQNRRFRFGNSGIRFCEAIGISFTCRRLVKFSRRFHNGALSVLRNTTTSLGCRTRKGMKIRDARRRSRHFSLSCPVALPAAGAPSSSARKARRQSHTSIAVKAFT